MSWTSGGIFSPDFPILSDSIYNSQVYQEKDYLYSDNLANVLLEIVKNIFYMLNLKKKPTHKKKPTQQPHNTTTLAYH